MTTKVLEQPREHSLAVFHGKDANSIFTECWCLSTQTAYATNKTRVDELLLEAIQRYAKSVPRLSAWLEDNLSEGFSVFDFPLEHRRTIRTTNSLERINKEIRRRTRLVGVFPNEASRLRLISAMLMEISEECQIGKHYCAGKSLGC